MAIQQWLIVVEGVLFLSSPRLCAEFLGGRKVGMERVEGKKQTSGTFSISKATSSQRSHCHTIGFLPKMPFVFHPDATALHNLAYLTSVGAFPITGTAKK